MQIINTNTTWSAGQVINLTDDIQVAQGVTLNIEPGVRVYGNNHSIQSFGLVQAKGKLGSEILFSNTNLTLSNNYQQLGLLIVDHAQIDGLSPEVPQGNGIYGSFSITNSIISNSSNSFWYAWYPQGENLVQGNILLNSAPIYFGIDYRDHSNTININHNIFDQYKNGAIVNWASYGGSTLIRDNAYLMVDKLTLSLPADYPSTALVSSGDYFGAANATQLQNMLYDKNDNLSSAGYVTLQNVRSTPPTDLPTDMFTFVSIEMPSDIVKTARVLGSADVALRGNKLDNVITVNSGNNVVDGGAGVDTVIVQGSSAQYQLSVQNGSVIIKDNISGRDGIDTLTNIEHVQFTDGTIAADLPVTADNALLYRLYQAAFARMPDEDGLRFWISAHYAGQSIATIAQSFLGATEFAQRYGSNLTNAQYVDLLYKNVLGRMGEADGVAYWNDALDTNKTTKDTVLIGFAASPENVKSTAAHINHGFFIDL